MFAHILDHFIFSARWKDSTKRVAFGICAFLLVGNFWWFRGMAWGIDGPINEHWGLAWRKVSLLMQLLGCALTIIRPGTYTTHKFVLERTLICTVLVSEILLMCLLLVCNGCLFELESSML